MSEKAYTLRDITSAICNKIGDHQSAAVKEALDEHFKGWFFTMWHWDDIKQQRHNSIGDHEEDDFPEDILTDEQCQAIEDFILRKHDANIGINWDVIEIATDEVLNN